VAEEGRWRYRDKVCLATAWNGDGWEFGLRLRDELIPIPHCPVHSVRVREAVGLLARALPPAPLFPLAFYAQAGPQATLVVKAHEVPDPVWLAPPLPAELAGIGLEGLWLNRHPAAGRRLFAKNGWRLLWGQPRSTTPQGLWHGPAAFQQLIPALYESALTAAEAFLTPSGRTPIVDLYCGIGASLARWTRAGAPAVGVELNGEAVECARRNAPGALVLRGKCADRLPQLNDWIQTAAETADRCALYVNPPRTGMEPEVLNWASQRFRPDRIAYLSCSAGTLRRDLEGLTGAGYRVERITPYDFFPQTYHVETLALLAAEDHR